MKPILLATDGSSSADAATREAIDLAHAFGAPLLVVSVAHTVVPPYAGYYGYIWSKVYGDDMWSRFEREGITDPAVGGSYRREILEPSASLDADEMLRRFLGREPSNATFLKLLGLVPA